MTLEALPVRVRWIECARMGERSRDGRQLEDVHVPDQVQAVRWHATCGGLHPLGVVDLRLRGSSIEARVIASSTTTASCAIAGSIDHPVYVEHDAGRTLIRGGQVHHVVVGTVHCWSDAQADVSTG